MRPGFVGIDLAIAKNKFLPVAVCTWEQGRLIPQRLRHLSARPPRGEGNAATLDPDSIQRFVREAARYVVRVCNDLDLTPARIAIDAPSAPRDPQADRRASEVDLSKRSISCFATPSSAEFDQIRSRVAVHISSGRPENCIPHANQLWMLVGFALFEELSRIAPCIEVFPQATARALGCGEIHKSRPGAVQAQLAAAARYTGWPLNREGECSLDEIAWGDSHDQLDAYLSAWVASLEEEEREAYGRPPDDAIWIPRIRAAQETPFKSAAERPERKPTSASPSSASPSTTFPCPACGEKEFKRWPWGWDAHAAHTCRGLNGTDPELRKIEFRNRFGQYL